MQCWIIGLLNSTVWALKFMFFFNQLRIAFAINSALNLTMFDCQKK